MMAQREPTASAGLRGVADTGRCYSDWAAVYADNAIWVYRMIITRVGNVPDAEDLTAEVFLAALRLLRTNATVAQVRGYLYAVTRSVLAAHWRQSTGCEITSIENVPEVSHEVDHAVDVATARQVRRVLASLPDNYRRILELRFLRGCSVKESARQMGVSVANAKVLQHRALRRAAALNDKDER
ncbi:RNA polymerase sigma-70 factor (ECF subfamily) [Mycolicibacterium moriokaense]|jgi:RNA polymerase sigma-70 factor (ECF subfamily)|uniref:RNA polymerase sigma-70 factor (ECF subfamily) n=2 Tax=Mycolicibacterium moriokaense TaxID=39691 RepID=A0A318HKC8_9MYCO|nr:RNA polymerase sigma-70 factor (ECF subfamily) [Mycolicibacterium moriokaense]